MHLAPTLGPKPGFSSLRNGTRSRFQATDLPTVGRSDAGLSGAARVYRERPWLGEMKTDQEGACQQCNPAEQDRQYRARPENERPLESRGASRMGWEIGIEGRHRGISFLTTLQFSKAKTMPDDTGLRAIQHRDSTMGLREQEWPAPPIFWLEASPIVHHKGHNCPSGRCDVYSYPTPPGEGYRARNRCRLHTITPSI